MSTTVRIVKTPDVLHGKPRIEGTRIGIFQIGELVQQQGWTIDDVTREFDIDAEQAQVALDYYDDHPEVVETLRAQHEARSQMSREGSMSGE